MSDDFIPSVTDVDFHTSLGGPSVYATHLQSVRDGFASLLWAAQNGELDGLLAELEGQIDERVFGQIMMEMLEDPEGLRPTVKQRLILVAEHMGPDWIEALRRAAAFMDKVESFR